MCKHIDGFSRVQILNLGSWLASSPRLSGEDLQWQFPLNVGTSLGEAMEKTCCLFVAGI